MGDKTLGEGTEEPRKPAEQEAAYRAIIKLKESQKRHVFKERGQMGVERAMWRMRCAGFWESRGQAA